MAPISARSMARGLYFIGEQLRRNGDERAERYFRNSLRSSPTSVKVVAAVVANAAQENALIRRVGATLKILMMADLPPNADSGAAGTEYQTMEALRRLGHEVDAVWADSLPHRIGHGNLHYCLSCLMHIERRCSGECEAIRMMWFMQISRMDTSRRRH